MAVDTDVLRSAIRDTYPDVSTDHDRATAGARAMGSTIRATKPG